MPSSPDTDLEKIKEQGQKIIEEKGGEVTKFEEEPIAFGIVALYAYTRVDEKKETDFIENAFRDLEGVSGVEIVDYRRAIE